MSTLLQQLVLREDRGKPWASFVMRTSPRCSGDVELRVPPDQEAIHPLWVMVGVEREVAGLLKEFGEHGAGLYARQSGPDTEMDAVPECQVALGGSPPQVHVIGVVELGMISIPGSEEQQGRGTGRDVDAAQGGVVRDAAHHVSKWRLEAQGLFHEHV